MYRLAYRANTGKSRFGNNNNRPSEFCHICMRNGHATQEGSAVVWWLMPRTLDPEVGGSSPFESNRVVSLSKAHLLPQKVLVIPRKRWLRPNMTEKLFTGTLRINQPTNATQECWFSGRNEGWSMRQPR